MTWVADPQMNFGQGLLKFLQSPEALALGQGLLAGSQPNMTQPVTFGGALAHGLGEFAKRRDIERQKEFDKAKVDIMRGHLNIDLKKFDLEEQKELRRLEHDRMVREALSPVTQNETTLPTEIRPAENISTAVIENQPEQKNVESKGKGLLEQVIEKPAMPIPVPPQLPSNNKIKLGIGWEVTPNQYQQIQGALLGGKPEKIVDIMGDLKDPELIKLAEFAYPGDPAKQRQFVIDAKMKPNNQVSIENKIEQTREDELTRMDVNTIKEHTALINNAKSAADYAEEAIKIIDRLDAAGIDPGLAWGKELGDIANVAARLGSKSSEAVVSDLKKLAKISTRLTVDMIPSLGGRPNQMIESRLLEATPGGPGIPNEAGRYLSYDIIDKARQTQYQPRFEREYFRKHQTLEGAQEAWEAWLDTQPFIKPAKNKSGFEIVQDKKILDSWKNFTFTPEELLDMQEFLNG